jgi:nascent polypeptide-associated complex subunit alpha
MMPGKMNSRQLSQMMKRFGINVKNIDNVEKVIIQTDTKEYIFEHAEVTVMDAQGQKTYQIIGEPTIKLKEEETVKDDVKLVMEQTGKSEAEARKALKETNGDIAEAIVKDAVRSSNEGVLIQLHVVPGSSHAVFPAGYNQWRKCVEIKVKAEAKDNKANGEIVETLAAYFQLSSKDVVLISGQKSREKTVLLKKVTLEGVCKKLEESLHGL